MALRGNDVVNPNEYQRFFEDPDMPNPVYDPMGELRNMLESAFQERGYSVAPQQMNEANPQDTVVAGLGQQYRNYPLADRFGQWPEDERQEGIRRLLEEFQQQTTPPAGFDVVDPLGHRGTRRPSGYYMLKGI